MPKQNVFKPDAFLEACLPGTTKEILTLQECITRLNCQDDEARAVLLLGETGVGKTYLARVIAMHRCWRNQTFVKTFKASPSEAEISEFKQWYVRTKGAGILKASGEPFREVPLPLLEGTLARSWLFGHEKGAFTGATKPSPGFLGEEGVTDVLLDEIGYASLDMQRSLLQVIQSGEYYRLNSSKKQTSEARLIFATNQDLEALVTRREFQEDLWWRLTDHVLYIPPLRERRSEIRPLATGMLAALNEEHIAGDGSGYLHLEKPDLEWADSHEWRGNVRELEKTVRRWFFYRGTRPLRDVWTQIEPFIPSRNPSATESFQLNEPQLRAMLRAQLLEAASGGSTLPSPKKLLDQLAEQARKRAAATLVAVLDEQSLPTATLSRVFKKYKISSLRSWMARNRH